MFEWCQSFSTSGTSAETDKAPNTPSTTTKPAKAASPKPASTSSAKPTTAPSTPGGSKPKSGAALALTTPQKPAAAAAVSSPAVGTASFVFGAGGGGGGNSFSFSGVKPRSPVKPRSREVSLNESGADEDDYYEGDEGEHLLFEPVVPLPDKVGALHKRGTPGELEVE